MVRASQKEKSNAKLKNIGIVDLDVGNVEKIITFFEMGGYNCDLINPEITEEGFTFRALVIPGIGNFGTVMRKVRQQKIDHYVKYSLAQGSTVIGICVGAQILLNGSEESSEFGLGLIQGLNCLNKGNLSPLNIGRKKVMFKNEKHREFDSTRYYFAHQYGAEIKDESLIAATTTEGIVAVFKKDNIYGLQFHPEKSGEVGINIIHGIMNGKL